MKIKITRLAFLLTLIVMLSCLFGCGSTDPEKAIVLKQFEDVSSSSKTATITTTLGDIKVVLFDEEAPKAVENFLTLSEQGYYDGQKFFSVINDYAIQTGDPKGDGSGGSSIWGEDFEDEFSWNLWNFRGALVMANRGEADTNGSQFFIVSSQNMLTADMIKEMQEGDFPQKVIDKYVEVGGAPWFDGKHTVFGYVYEGMDIVDKISALDTIPNTSTPMEDITIEINDINK